MPDDLQEIQGAIHLHSRYSDGSATVEQILAQAREAALDFVILTDHDSVAARDDGLEGWHDGVLLIVGAEISPRRGDHFLALGARRVPEGKSQPDTEKLMRSVAENGGTIYIAHPQGRAGRSRPRAGEELPNWRHWRSELYQGLEIWSYMHDCLSGFRPWKLRRLLRDPDASITGPEARVLRRWDALNRHRRVVGIGALDNHAQRIPFPPWRILPHGQVFASFRTHVLVRRFQGNNEADVAAVLEALGAGHTFTAFDALGESAGIRFAVRAPDGQCWPMGDELPWRPGLTVEAHSPRPATLTIVRDGKPWQSSEGTRLEARVATPGVYRLEGRRGGRPWVFTNPVLVRDPGITTE